MRLVIKVKALLDDDELFNRSLGVDLTEHLLDDGRLQFRPSMLFALGTAVEHEILHELEERNLMETADEEADRLQNGQV